MTAQTLVLEPLYCSICEQMTIHARIHGEPVCGEPHEFDD